MTSARRASWGTVRVRVTAAATLVVTFALIVSSWFVVRAVRTSLREDLRTESALALADALKRFENRGPSNPLPVPSPSGFVIVAVERDGTIRDGSPGLTARTWAQFVGRSSQDPAIVGRTGRPFPQAIAGEQHIWFVAGRIFNFVPVVIDRRPGYLVAAGTQATIDSSVKTVTSALTWTVPGLILFMGVVAWAVTGRALRPVEKIRRDVAEISASSIGQRVYEPRARDEVGRLARTMNQMLDRLHDSSTRQRQFVSDASHELRSPVAAIRATGEVALSHPDTAEWPAVVERILTEDARMERIVGDLLDLARSDEVGVPTTIVDLDDIVFDEASQIRRPGVVLNTDHVSAGRVRGSREQLTRIVRNLLGQRDPPRAVEGASDVELLRRGVPHRRGRRPRHPSRPAGSRLRAVHPPRRRPRPRRRRPRPRPRDGPGQRRTPRRLRRHPRLNRPRVPRSSFGRPAPVTGRSV